MSAPDPVIRIAARGDGVTAAGTHIAGAVPGDAVADDGTIVPGPHRAVPPCRHFGRCGGCQLQHADDGALAAFVHDRVVLAAAGQGLDIADVLPVHLSPPRSRRRALLHAQMARGSARLGFREAGSHRIVDMAECHVVTETLFAQIAPVRALLRRQSGRAVEVTLAQTDQGIDLLLSGARFDGLEATEALLAFAGRHGLARVTIDQGYGPEGVWEPHPVTVTMSGTPVPYPPAAFLQATSDGEAALVADARRWLAGAGHIADLFAGLGTFALAVEAGTRVLAAEAAREAVLALRQAAARSGRAVEAVHRDLFRNPLMAEELARFDAVLLDPPRAGARAQVERLAQGGPERVVYISCNPASWARDAALLVAGGYRLEAVRPVGQFRWSTHVELTSLFVR